MSHLTKRAFANNITMSSFQGDGSATCRKGVRKVEASTLKKPPDLFVAILSGHCEGCSCHITEHPDATSIRVGLTDDEARVLGVLDRVPHLGSILGRFATAGFDLAFLAVRKAGNEERPRQEASEPISHNGDPEESAEATATLERVPMQFVAIRHGSHDPFEVHISKGFEPGLSVQVILANIERDVLGVIKNAACLQRILQAFAQAGFKLGLKIAQQMPWPHRVGA